MPPSAHDSRRADVLLCSLPFGLVPTPSLALGLLQAALASLPVRTRQLHFSLDFLRRVGYGAYSAVSERWEAGDWVFAQELFPESDLDPSGFVEDVLRRPSPEARSWRDALPAGEAERWVERSVEAALLARREARGFLADCLEEVVRQRPVVLGFTCLFQQRVAALALARAVKRSRPETLVVFGGPECHGSRGSELLRQFAFVDAVVSGPGELALPEIVRRVLSGRELSGLPGVGTQGDPEGAERGEAPGPESLDELPFPLFDDFYERLQSLDAELPVQTYLSLETSRGCWWGERPERHCLFCGLNGRRIGYRAKSTARAVAELEHFARRYPGQPLVLTDSILAPDAFQQTLPALAERGLGAEIQYETRATLSREELLQLRDSGVTQLQPGIESLDTGVLRLMRKGTTALQNVQLLKWCRELGLRVLWNLLGGLPGEDPAAYAGMAALIPRLAHLPPPARFRRVELVPHSPMFERAAELGLADVRPSDAYRHVFPFDGAVLSALATRFDYAFRPGEAALEDYGGRVAEAVAAWRRAHAASELWMLDDGRAALVVDSRPGATARLATFSGLERWTLLACAGIRHERDLLRCAQADGGPDLEPHELRSVLEGLEARGLLVHEGSRWLGLPLQAEATLGLAATRRDAARARA